MGTEEVREPGRVQSITLKISRLKKVQFIGGLIICFEWTALRWLVSFELQRKTRALICILIQNDLVYLREDCAVHRQQMSDGES